MLFLALNTASRESAVALLENQAVLGEISWESNANESEKLLPAIQNLLTNAKKTWKDLGGIVLVAGPGAFTSLRVGIAIGNAMAWFLKIPLWGVNVFKVWETRISESDRSSGHLIAIRSGKNHYLIENDAKLYSLEELSAPRIYGEIPDDFLEKGKIEKSFGQAVSEILKEKINLESVSNERGVLPIYMRPPGITQRKSQN